MGTDSIDRLPEAADMNTEEPLPAEPERMVPRYNGALGARLGPPPELKRREPLLERRFSTAGRDPYLDVEWDYFDAAIVGADGKPVFEQKRVDFPKSWSQTAVNVVSSKYFRGQMGTTQREDSLRWVINRVVDTIKKWGLEGGYFDDFGDAAVFGDELRWLIVNQCGSFNSPVWFNVGVQEKPQCSACQPYSARVSTPAGMVPIGEIVERNLIGMPVYDQDGATTVLAVKPNGIKAVFRVVLRNALSIEATADHRVLAVDERRGVPEWLRIDELKIGMRLRLMPHRRSEALAADEIDISKAALAGWLLTGGYVGKPPTSSSLIIELETVNQQEFDWVSHHLATVFPEEQFRTIEEETDDQSLQYRRLRSQGERFRPFTEEFGLTKRGADKRVPESIFRAAPAIVAAFLRSVFQADGYVRSAQPGAGAAIGLRTISRGFAQDLQLLLLRLGIYSRVCDVRDAREDRQPGYVIKVSYLNDRAEFSRQVGFISDNKTNRLNATLLEPGKVSPDVREEEIVAIEPLGEQPVYDIQTSSGNYLSNNVVVHNCFILKLDDSMESILDWYRDEGMIFRSGSGAGVNISALRAENEPLNNGGKASGPLSFMKAADASAGVIKSGGKTRRAAKMVVMNVDHPDILKFINCKVHEERKAKALMAAGYSGGIDGEAFSSVAYQNANNSVRVTDGFMQAVENGEGWTLRYRADCRGPLDSNVPPTLAARSIMRQIAEAAWECGDPGMQFDTIINDWHTCPNSGLINASNPCSEYMHLDNSACNLASLNLLKFLKDDGEFDVDGYKHAIDVFITAMDIIVDNSSYPTPEIEKNAHDYRQLGLGYCNLGATLMAQGLAYDSEEGRDFAAAVTTLMTGEAYAQSGRLAKRMGPFAGYEKNREPMLKVIENHASFSVLAVRPAGSIWQPALDVWDDARYLGKTYGFRNSQATVIAPTGTIAFMMDADTTGIEPDIALVKYKSLVGGGTLKIVNQTVERALKKLGYNDADVYEVKQHISWNGTIEGLPRFKPNDLPVFDCAFKPENGTRSISWEGHVKMCAAVQPFVSGAISKTINLPAEATVEDVEKAYLMAWKLGLKAIAIYRDGSKGVQPVSTSAGESRPAGAESVLEKGLRISDALVNKYSNAMSELAKHDVLSESAGHVCASERRKLPNERPSVIKKFDIAGHEGYITIGKYADGSPGEMFLKVSKEGSTLAGFADALAIAVSLGLQYGVPLNTYVKKFSRMSFEPHGFTGEKDIGYASSIVDYVFRWLEHRFLLTAQEEALENLERAPTPPAPAPMALNGVSGPMAAIPEGGEQLLIERVFDQWAHQAKNSSMRAFDGDAPACPDCGGLMKRAGTCLVCQICGTTSGCS